jgi:hypothetical protein
MSLLRPVLANTLRCTPRVCFSILRNTTSRLAPCIVSQTRQVASSAASSESTTAADAST